MAIKIFFVFGAILSSLGAYFVANSTIQLPLTWAQEEVSAPVNEIDLAAVAEDSPVASEVGTEGQGSPFPLVSGIEVAKNEEEKSKVQVIAAVSKTPATPPPTSTFLPLSHVPYFATKAYWAFSSTTGFHIPTTRSLPASSFIDAASIKEQPINPGAIVLVRCIFKPTFVTGARGGSDLPEPFSGTGIVVSPEGHIVTAAHVVRIKELDEEDTERTWTRLGCEVAPTDTNLSPIEPRLTKVPAGAAPFIPAAVVFEPSDEQYNWTKVPNPDNPIEIIDWGPTGLDFALLQVDDRNLPYVPLLSGHPNLKQGEPILGVGYPGVTGSPFELERIDGAFYAYIWNEHSTCESKPVIEQCGVQYQTRRYKSDYAKLYGVRTNLGKYTSYIRGGFSGGPLFYKGYVAGIMNFRREGSWSNLYDLSYTGNWNWIEGITSHEMLGALKEAGIVLPTIP